jgi:hypothetical protein
VHSVATAIKDAIVRAAKMKMNATSDCELVVVKIVNRMRKEPLQRPNDYDKDFCEFNSLRVGSKYGMPDEVRTDVWSSRKGNL